MDLISLQLPVRTDDPLTRARKINTAITTAQSALNTLITAASASSPSAPQPPAARFTLQQPSSMSIYCDASTSTGTGLTYGWAFGDGQTGSGLTPSHTYATAGTYRVALTIVDSAGATSSTAHNITITAPSGGGGSGSGLYGYLGTGPTSSTPWNTGDPAEGFGSVAMVNYTDLYQSGDTDLYATLQRLSSPAVVVLPNGFDGVANSPQAINGLQLNSQYGINVHNWLGFYCAGGPTQARVYLQPNSFSSASLAKIPAQSTGSSGGVNPLNVLFAQAKNFYIGGVTFQGSDQPQNAYSGEYGQSSGPANYIGLQAYAASQVIINNSRFLGFSKSNNSANPGETATIGITGLTNPILRRIESDGRLAAATAGNLASPAMDSNSIRGGNPWSASHVSGLQVTDFYAHYAYAATGTSSYSSSGNWSKDVTLTNVRVENLGDNTATLSQTEYSYGGYAVPGLNFEYVQGTISIIRPTVHFGASGVYLTGNWSHGHILCGANANSGPFTMYVEDPTWDQSYYGGCFTIRNHATFNGQPSSVSPSAFVVKLNGVVLTQHVVTSKSAGDALVASGTLNPARDWILVNA